MNYKTIIISRKFRIKLLNFFNFVPDKLMIKIQYRIATGRKLNLKNPKRFSEKLQWYKLYYRNPLLKICSDKFKVREYIKEKKMNEILVPLIKIYSSEKDVNIDELPASFVIKTTLGAGNNQVIVINDKKNINKIDFENKVKKWKLNGFKKSISREWGYQSKDEKIIVEENLVTKHNQPAIDYKFFCFNGEPKFLYVITNRSTPNDPNIDVYDMNFNRLPVERPDKKPSHKTHIKPKNFNEMIDIAKILSSDFPHVRVDLYNFDEKIYFSEMTFYNGSGYIIYKPDEYDFKIGNFFSLIKY